MIFIPKDLKSKIACVEITRGSIKMVRGIIQFHFGWSLSFFLFQERRFIWLLEIFVGTIFQCVAFILFTIVDGATNKFKNNDRTNVLITTSNFEHGVSTCVHEEWNNFDGTR